MRGIKTLTVSHQTYTCMPPIDRIGTGNGATVRKRYYALRAQIRRLGRRSPTCYDFEWHAESLSLKPWSDAPVRRWINEQGTCILGLTVIAPKHKLP